MPFSKAQLGWAHTAGKKVLGKKTLAKWDKEAKGKKLPQVSHGAHEKKGWA